MQNLFQLRIISTGFASESPPNWPNDQLTESDLLQEITTVL